MANWSELKAAVASIVKTNGNKEITGQLLQNVLNNIISNVGLNSTFAGIATPETNPGTPDGNVFYLATTAGTYSNFNGIFIQEGEAVIIEWKGSWKKKTPGFATQEKLYELGAKFGGSKDLFIHKVLMYDSGQGVYRYHLRMFLKTDRPIEISFSSNLYYCGSAGIVNSIEDGLQPVNMPFIEKIITSATQNFSAKTTKSGYLMLSIRENDSTNEMTDATVSTILSEIKLSVFAGSELLLKLQDTDGKLSKLETGNEKYIGVRDIKFDESKVTMQGVYVARKGYLTMIPDGVYEFTKNSILVLHADDTAEIVVGAANVKTDDIALLYYVTDLGFCGGSLYPYYVEYKTKDLPSKITALSGAVFGLDKTQFLRRIVKYWDEVVGSYRWHLRLFMYANGASISVKTEKYFCGGLGVVSTISDGLHMSPNWIDGSRFPTAVKDASAELKEKGYICISLRTEDSTVEMTEETANSIVDEILISGSANSRLLSDIKTLRNNFGYSKNDLIRHVINYSGDTYTCWHMRLFAPINGETARVRFKSKSYFCSGIGLVESIADALSFPIKWKDTPALSTATPEANVEITGNGYICLSVRTEDSTVEMTEEIASAIMEEISISVIAESELLNEIKELKSELYNVSTEHNITSDDIGIYNNKARGVVHFDNRNEVTINLKLNESSPYQFAVGGYKNGVSKEIEGYSRGTSVMIPQYAYEFIYILFKKGDNEIVAIDEFISAIEYQDIHYSDVQIEIPQNIQLYNLGKFLNTNDNAAKSEYLAVPRQNAKINFHLPSYLRVCLQYGSRDYIGTTDYYTNGQSLQMTDEMVGVRIVVASLDNRGVSAERLNRCYGKSFAITIDEEPYDINTVQNDCEKYALALSATPTFTVENQIKLPIICHTSDIHGDVERFESMNKFAKNIKADLIVNTGDTCLYVMNDGVKFCEDVVNRYGVDYAVCVGNHDTYGADNIAYDECIKPFIQSQNYMLSEGVKTDKTYYYKDMDEYKLRIISLDIYEGINTSNYKARISQEQITWFINSLASSPEGYGVIVILHQTPNSINPIEGKENFNSTNMIKGQLNIASDYMKLGKIEGNPIGKIIDAFIGRTTISGSYKNTYTYEEIPYNADFRNVKDGVEFIMYLNGHVHKDYVGYLADCEHNQLNVNVTACTAMKSKIQTPFSGDYDCPRGTYGSVQDAFNMYIIDRNNHRVGIARIGSNMSYNLVDRKAMWVSYL